MTSKEGSTEVCVPCLYKSQVFEIHDSVITRLRTHATRMYILEYVYEGMHAGHRSVRLISAITEVKSILLPKYDLFIHLPDK